MPSASILGAVAARPGVGTTADGEDCGLARRLTRAWLVWAVAAGLYAYGFFQRVAPAVIVDDLMLAFALDATLMGTLSAAYFYTYAALQVPLGVLIDRFGPRLVLTAGALTAAVGGILFATAGGFGLALLARALIGGGVAVGYIGTLKLVAAWFPLQRFGLLAGLTLAAGTAGAVGAQLPLALVVDALGWRPTLLAMGALGLAMAALVVAVVRDHPPEDGPKAGAAPLAARPPAAAPGPGLAAILARPETWLLVATAGLTGAPILTFAGLWGVPYFVQVHGLERTAAAMLTSLMLVAWAVGGPVLGTLADRVASRPLLILWLAALNGALWLPFLILPSLPLALAIPLVAGLGFAGGGMIVAFAITRTVFGMAAAGRALGIVNTAVLLLGAAMQTAFGVLLDWRWTGAVIGGNRVYDAPAYAGGFALFTLAAVLVLLAAFGLWRAERQHKPATGP
jgi:sugar phosphate permease